MPTDTSEKGLETLIYESLVYDLRYVEGHSHDFDKDHAIDLVKLMHFLKETQLIAFESLELAHDGPKRRRFLHRVHSEIAKRGVIDVLRKGIKDGPVSVDLFFGAASVGNKRAEELFKSNIFSITRQLRYSKDKTRLSLDLCVFINGLPVITFELKNRLTKQTANDAIQQYKRDRDPRELLFQFGRCIVHFALDDHEANMCTHLKGNDSWFLPFNQGWNDGAGNPPKENGILTDYLWKEVLTKDRLSDIIENYAQIVEESDERGKKKRKQVFPRYHQLDVVRKLLKAARVDGVGKRYLIQHSAGSGKSNSIAWLAHQLVGVEKNGNEIFDSIIVVTDRRVLDKQIRDTIKQFAQVSSKVGHAARSGDLRRFLKEGKKIIITTVQKFPVILSEIGDDHRNRKFAILIDEAHSSQGGKTTAQMNIALSDQSNGENEETTEDKINHIVESRKMLTNASYFAFTATPKNKTLEIFGQPYQEEGVTKYRPFHSYTMKQAIQERFIMDVLQSFTPVVSYYKLISTINTDPEYDKKKAQKKLRLYVESHQHAIREKAEIMVDHFHDQVLARRKIGGKARAMVVTSGVNRAIQYYFAIEAYLKERKSPFHSIVAFSEEREIEGRKVTEAILNGFPSNSIPKKFKEDPYRILIVADKFLTGFDEPLLHTMYVDKPLSDIKAVQTLSRLNRAHPQKHDTFVLDFMNDVDTIQKAFQDYYRTTILSEATDENKLHDLQSDLDSRQVYTWEHVERFVELYLSEVPRDQLDPLLNRCVSVYRNDLDEEEQVLFKSQAKSFVRTYNFLSSILPFSIAEWEKLSIFLNFLIPKLPAPKEDDLSKGILEAVDMDSYRVEVKASLEIALADQNAEIEPVPTSEAGFLPETQLDRLSNILKTFNDHFGNIQWMDKDKIEKIIFEEIPAKVAADKAYQNAKENSDMQNARLEHDRALQKVMIQILADNTELFKQFSDNHSFRKWLESTIFSLTYEKDGLVS